MAAQLAHSGRTTKSAMNKWWSRCDYARAYRQSSTRAVVAAKLILIRICLLLANLKLRDLEYVIPMELEKLTTFSLLV